ncbi:MAG TPA: ABC transporter permease [Acidimicrobiia bacterium]|nr:ABC transporter permease [Acidimicrobiia bacterium]
MTATAAPRRRVSFASATTHTAVITWRNVMRVVRLPQLLLFSTIQPVMFLLLFNYVFGGAISIGGDTGAVGADNYINWLIPGILVQSTVFGATATALGLTEDLAAGVIDRFRSLPMARSAVLTGRTLADLVRNTFVTTLMLVVGFMMGWRFEQGFLKMVLGVSLALLFGYAFSWLMATIGLLAKTPEAAQSAGFLPIFPLVFASSVFVPTDSMPDWLQVFADNQPISIIANTVRSLMIPEPALGPLGLEQGTLIWQSLAWIVVIIAVFAPLAVRQYRRSVA